MHPVHPMHPACQAHRERLDRERRLMAENAKKARAAAGERVIFEATSSGLEWVRVGRARGMRQGA